MARLVLKSRHRVMCGDSTSAQDVEHLMAADVAGLLFTSPPYAQQRDYGVAKEKISAWDALMQGVIAAAPVAHDAQLLINLGLVHRDNEWMPYWSGWIEWMREQGWRRFGWYVWDQGYGLIGDWNGRLAPAFEFVFHFNRAARRPNKIVPCTNAGDLLGGGGLRSKDGVVQKKTGDGNPIQPFRIPDSVIRVTRHSGGIGDAGSHPAVFPIRLAEEVLRTWTNEGDIVFEPFCGSGSQIIAAERTGRRCWAMELDPAYVDVTCRRWLLFTGDAPVHEATGRTFSEMTDGQADA